MAKGSDYTAHQKLKKNGAGAIKIWNKVGQKRRDGGAIRMGDFEVLFCEGVGTKKPPTSIVSPLRVRREGWNRGLRQGGRKEDRLHRRVSRSR